MRINNVNSNFIHVPSKISVALNHVVFGNISFTKDHTIKCPSTPTKMLIVLHYTWNYIVFYRLVNAWNLVKKLNTQINIAFKRMTSVATRSD